MRADPADVATAALAVIATAVVTDVTPSEILGRSRTRHRALARHVATAVIRSETPLSFPQIAELMNREDHSTVWHSVRRVESDPVLAARAVKVRVLLRPPTVDGAGESR